MTQAITMLLAIFQRTAEALRATPTMQKKSEEALRKYEANSKEESYAFHADHTVDITAPSPKPTEHGTWRVSSNAHGELGLQILQGTGKGNNSFEPALVFNATLDGLE